MARMVSVFIFLLTSALFLGGCEKSEEGEVVARVNDETLTAEELEELIPSEAMFRASKEQKEEFVKKWIESELLYQEALKRGLDKEKRMELVLQEARKQILANELLTVEMSDAGDVSEQEVADYFNLHKEDYNVSLKMAHILLPTEEEAKAVLERLKEGESFSELAKKRSQDQESGEKGGLLGYFKKDDMEVAGLRALEEVAFSLKKGELSEAVRTDYGYHILKVLARSPLEKKVTVDDVRDRIKWLLSRRRQNEAVANWLAELKEKADIEVHYEVLR